MFTADQILAHAIGDYIFQSHWMATQKVKNSVAAAIHAVTYTLPFLFITRSPEALVVICGTHFLIDRFRLARFIVWFKNGPLQLAWVDQRFWLKPVTATGYPEDVPPWLAVWLLIAADNIAHICINGAAIWYWGAS